MMGEKRPLTRFKRSLTIEGPGPLPAVAQTGGMESFQELATHIELLLLRDARCARRARRDREPTQFRSAREEARDGTHRFRSRRRTHRALSSAASLAARREGQADCTDSVPPHEIETIIPYTQPPEISLDE